MELKRWCFNTDIRVFGTAMREHSRFSDLLNNSALTVKSAVLALRRPAPLGSTGQNNTDLTPKSFTQRLAAEIGQVPICTNIVDVARADFKDDQIVSFLGKLSE